MISFNLFEQHFTEQFINTEMGKIAEVSEWRKLILNQKLPVLIQDQEAACY